jgi:hypothetical protein
MKTEILAVLAQAVVLVLLVGAVVLKKGWVPEALLSTAVVGAVACMALGLVRLSGDSSGDDLVGTVLLVAGVGLTLGAAAISRSIFARERGD